MRTLPPLLEIRLLGTFQVLRGGETIPDPAWSRRNARTLFKFLLLCPNRRCHKEQALDLLWPKLQPAAANNNLHKTLFHLRRTLCPKVSDARACPYVEFDGDIIALTPDLVGAVDAEVFEARAAEALAASDSARYAAALDLYTGDLLPDERYVDWVIARREVLRQIYLNLLRQLGDLHAARHEHEAAIAVWGRLLTAEPADEATHCALMRAYALAGQRHHALRQFHLCRQALARELDAEPLPETTALYGAIASGDIAPEPALASTLSLAPPPHPLIGREAEMKTLLDALDAAVDGHPRLALIAGEAGIGKTLLAHEVARAASERGLSVLAGSTFEPVGALHEPPLPYGPFVEALRQFFGGQPLEIRQHLLGPWQADLARLLPELGGEVSAPALEPETAKRRLFEAAAHVLSAIGAARPAVLLLDDLHAADQATLELLGYLLHRPAPFGVFVLALVREESAPAGLKPPSSSLTDVLARVGRRGLLTRLNLSRLTPAETAQLVRDRLSGTVEAALVNAIYEASEGNPLFAEQLLQAWQEEGALVAEADRWQLSSSEQPLPLPTGLREIITLRLARLSSEDQAMLALAAVMGREFPYAWLQAAGSWDESALLDLLDEALLARVLEEVSQRTGPLLYRFHHGLIRQTVYEGLSEARRRHMHQRVAEMLEGLADVPFSALSHHWFAVGRWPWAFCHALTAADLARRAFAHAEAVSLYDRALAAVRDHWRPDDGLIARVHTGRAQALMGLNRLAEAVTDLEWLTGQARASGDRAAYGRALSQLATAHFWGHNLDAARRLAQEALTIAQGAGDDMTAIMCTSNLGCIALSTGRLEEGTRYLEEVLQAARNLGRPGMIAESLACLPGAYHWHGESARSLPLLEEGIAIARREGLGFWLGTLLFFAGMAHGSLGHYEEALGYFRQGQRYSQEAGDIFTALRTANSLGWIHYELYDAPNAIAHDRQGVEMARGFPWPEPLANALVNLGFDYLLIGDLAQAESAFDEATALLNRDVWMEWRWHTRLLMGQGWLALARRDLSRADEHARQALALAEDTAALKNQARAHLLLGEIARTAGEAARAARLLHRAVGLSQAVENPRLLWQSLDELARAEAGRGDEQAAAEARSRAAEVIRAIAAGLHDEDLRRTFLDAGPVQAVLHTIP